MLSNFVRVLSSSRSVAPAILKSQGNMLTRSMINSTNFSTDSLRVCHDADNKQFYIETDRGRAHVLYEKDGNCIKYIHTEVPNVFRGKGVAKVLAQEVMLYALKNNLSVEIYCDYLMKYYDTNKDKFKPLQVMSKI